jgi:hypothetical protein
MNIPPEIQRTLDEIRARLIAHLDTVDDETTEMLADLKAAGYVCELFVEVSVPRQAISRAAASAPNHTCRQDRNRPCEACAVFAPFRRGNYNDFRQGQRPDDTSAVETYRPKPEPELELTGLDITWLGQQHIKVTD